MWEKKTEHNHADNIIVSSRSCSALHFSSGNVGIFTKRRKKWREREQGTNTTAAGFSFLFFFLQLLCSYTKTLRLCSEMWLQYVRVLVCELPFSSFFSPSWRSALILFLFFLFQSRVLFFFFLTSLHCITWCTLPLERIHILSFFPVVRVSFFFPPFFFLLPFLGVCLYIVLLLLLLALPLQYAFFFFLCMCVNARFPNLEWCRCLFSSYIHLNMCVCVFVCLSEHGVPEASRRHAACTPFCPFFFKFQWFASFFFFTQSS